MEVCILPISGGGFPIQVASCCLMADIKYVPDIVFASSGGSICAFVMLASEWNALRVPMIMENLSADMFVEHWNFPILQKLYSISKGSIFNNGTGGENLFVSLFNSEKLQKVETWVGAYNKDLRRFKMTTNRSRSTCSMNLSWSDLMLNNLCDIDYASGDAVKMSEFISASCAIPGLVPHKHIEGHDYVDGGVVCASPLGYFRNSLVDLAKKQMRAIHFFTSCCEDQNKIEGGCYQTSTDGGSGLVLIQNMMDIVSSMINVSLVRDRVACNDVLMALGSTLVGTVTFIANYDTLSTLQKFKNCDACGCGSILEMFIDVECYMDMATFDGETCLRYMEEAEGKMKCRLWVYCNAQTTEKTILQSEHLKKLRKHSLSDTMP